MWAILSLSPLSTTEAWSVVFSTKVWNHVYLKIPFKMKLHIYLAKVIIVGLSIKDKSCSRVFIIIMISRSSVMWIGRVVVIPAEWTWKKKHSLDPVHPIALQLTSQIDPRPGHIRNQATSLVPRPVPRRDCERFTVQTLHQYFILFFFYFPDNNLPFHNQQVHEVSLSIFE